MRIPVHQVDAFTAEPFRGNPAAVCVIDEPLPDELMQSIAAEMNLSETAFARPLTDGFELRWFTPTAEVALCGHATLATCHVLWETARIAADEAACFHSQSGPLSARRCGDAIEMDFPTYHMEPITLDPELHAALGAPTIVGATRTDEGGNTMIEVPSEQAVLDIAPDFRRLLAAERDGIIVTARSERPGIDFVSRYFAVAYGIDEDPVTGSAHCCLAPYWASRLGRTEMTGYQASSRGGTVHVRLRRDRVGLRGHAVTVLRGELDIPLVRA